MKKHVNIHVSGHVQGVGFRFETRKMAINYGVSGFVRNEYDGSVYIEAEAENDRLELFIFWCKEGPGHARVKDIELSDGALKNFSSFTIKH